MYTLLELDGTVWKFLILRLISKTHQRTRSSVFSRSPLVFVPPGWCIAFVFLISYTDSHEYSTTLELIYFISFLFNFHFQRLMYRQFYIWKKSKKKNLQLIFYYIMRQYNNSFTMQITYYFIKDKNKSFHLNIFNYGISGVCVCMFYIGNSILERQKLCRIYLLLIY